MICQQEPPDPMRLIIPLLLLVLVGCAPIPHHLTDHYLPALEESQGWQVQPLWAHDLLPAVESGALLAPLLVDNILYAAGHEGQVRAMDAESGKLLWQRQLQGSLTSGPILHGELLLLGGDAEVIALHPHDGRELWRSRVSSEVIAAPAADFTGVAVRTGDGRLYWLDRQNGAIRWQSSQRVPSLTLRGASPPLLVGGRLLVGGSDGQLRAFNRDDGRLLWESTIALPRGRNELERIVDLDGQLVTAGGLVYVSSQQGSLAAVTLATGQILWSRDIASFTGPLVVGDTLYLTDNRGNLWALQRLTGATLWRQDALQRRLSTRPVAQGDAIVIGDSEGWLHWFDRDSGHPLARQRIGRWHEYFPRHAPYQATLDWYPLARSVHMAPVVEGRRIAAVDRRGAINLFAVTVEKP
jgi:outer membrane protein assembly factor BamB